MIFHSCNSGATKLFFRKGPNARKLTIAGRKHWFALAKLSDSPNFSVQFQVEEQKKERSLLQTVAKLSDFPNFVGAKNIELFWLNKR